MPQCILEQELHAKKGAWRWLGRQSAPAHPRRCRRQPCRVRLNRTGPAGPPRTWPPVRACKRSRSIQPTRDSLVPAIGCPMQSRIAALPPLCRPARGVAALPEQSATTTAHVPPPAASKPHRSPAALHPRHPAPPHLPQPVDRQRAVFRGQRHAGHGSGLADGGADRLFLPGRAGADGRVPAHVRAGPARRRAGRHHRPPAPHPGALAVQTVSVVLLAAAGAAAGWGGPATLLLLTFVTGCCTAMLSPAWNSGGGRDPAARRTAAGHHCDEHRLQRRPRRGAHAGRPGVRPASSLGGGVGGGAVGSRWRSAASWCWPGISTAAPAQGRTHRPGCRPSACGAARWPGCATPGIPRPSWRNWCARPPYSAAGSALWALLPVIGQRGWALGARASAC
jgi:hypothetical protein